MFPAADLLGRSPSQHNSKSEEKSHDDIVHWRRCRLCLLWAAHKPHLHEISGLGVLDMSKYWTYSFRMHMHEPLPPLLRIERDKGGCLSEQVYGACIYKYDVYVPGDGIAHILN